MKKTLYILLFVAILLPAKAQLADTDNWGELRGPLNPSKYDSLLAALNTRNAHDAYELFENEFIDFKDDGLSNPLLTDDVCQKRLRMLATEIQLPYNPVVKSYIDRYLRNKETFEYILGMGKYYFPIFEKALYEYGLPMELKMLPVIESALTPKAASRASAVGLWQFMLPTGKYYGLEVNSFVDDRCNPVRSTDAACRYLKDLFEVYGDWSLVIAAYNCGPGNVARAMKRVPGAKSYWDIWDYLPKETRGYVPTFIAATYVYTFYKAHDLRPKEVMMPLATDTVQINKLTHLEQISSTIDLPLEVLRELNPQLLIDIVPATRTPYQLVIPELSRTDFMEHEAAIYAKDSTYLAKYLNIENLTQAQLENVARGGSSKSGGGNLRATYKVKKGDTLGRIAARY
ncbi:MAG: transglycosylase SLT domain-containing protein, partial [Mucinivorans sp.]